MKIEKTMSVAAIGVTLVISWVGCTGPSVGPRDPVSWTPPQYKEHRTLFVRASSDPDLADLRFSHQAESTDLAVKNSEPLAIVVNSVFLPRDFEGTKDVAVLLDVQTRDEPVSMAVWYQKGVSAGQELGFRDLLVYSDRSWKTSAPPFFRLRVIDVRQEENEQTRSALESLSSAIGSLNGFIPHAAVPIASRAVQVAGLVLSNRNNETIIDYSSQFYSLGFSQSSGDSDVAVLMRGSWLFLARPRGQQSEFWDGDLKWNRRSGVVTREGMRCGAPYGRMTVSTYDAVVPTIAIERSQALFEQLASARRSGLDDGSVDNALQSVVSGVRTFSAHSRLVKNRTMDNLTEVMLLLENRGESKLTRDDVSFLVSVVGRLRGKNFSGVEDALQWWADHGKGGVIDQDQFLWKAS